jgi:hypothetical protein
MELYMQLLFLKRFLLFRLVILRSLVIIYLVNMKFLLAFIYFLKLAKDYGLLGKINILFLNLN